MEHRWPRRTVLLAGALTASGLAVGAAVAARLAKVDGHVVRPTPVTTRTGDVITRTGDVITRTGDLESYSAPPSPYSAFMGMWGKRAPGNDQMTFAIAMRIQPTSFPAETRFDWTINADPDYDGVEGYLHIDYGNYYWSPASIMPKQVDAITDLTIRVDWTFTGSSAGLLSELWLSNQAMPSGPFTKTHKIAFMPRLSAPVISYLQTLPAVGSGTFTDSDGIIWRTVQGSSDEGLPYLVAYRPDLSSFTGPLRYRDYLAYLKAVGKITGSEWVNGVAYGVEVRPGTASLTINQMSVSYA